jgi:hypothetical protein
LDDKIKEGERGEYVARTNAYKILVEHFEGTRQFLRPRLRKEDDTKMDLKGIVWTRGDWIHLAQDRDQ